MLRKKLMIILAVLVSLMLGTTLTSLVLMQRMLGDLERTGNAALISAAASNRLATDLIQIESELSAPTRLAPPDHELLARLVDSLIDDLTVLGAEYTVTQDGLPLAQSLLQSSIILEAQLTILAQAPEEDIEPHVESVLHTVGVIRSGVLERAENTLKEMTQEQQAVTSRFRKMAIGLAISFVLLINISILVLLRAAILILRPVDRLVEASRALAIEDYSHRVEIRRYDEFDEMAQAFNQLGEQLQSNEERKVEMLQHVARTLNHELNNAIAIIELQLSLVSRSPGYDGENSGQLRLIHETLSRMSETVVSLTQVRRIVLTDYIEGVKMLDLKRSTQVEYNPSLDTDPERGS